MNEIKSHQIKSLFRFCIESHVNETIRFTRLFREKDRIALGEPLGELLLGLIAASIDLVRVSPFKR